MSEIGPFATGILKQFVAEFGDTEITGQQMFELYGAGEAGTVADLTPLQLLQFAFASALRTNAALREHSQREAMQARIAQLTRGVAPFAGNRRQRRHG